MQIRNLVGDVDAEQIKFVDSFICDKLGLFIPSVGPCYYAISKDHTHPSYSFILNFDDHCQVDIGGKLIMSIPGKLSAISPDITHHEVLTGNFARYIAILIDKEFFEQQLDEYSIQVKKVFNAESFDIKNDLKALLKDFMCEYENKMPCYKELLDAISLRITHSIIRTVYDFRTPKEESSNRIIIDKVIEYIHSHYDEKLDVKTLSDIASLSPSHFSRLFKQNTEKSPMSYLIETRLEKSKKLLISGDFTVTDIAYKTGFSSSSHFANLFTERFEVTPSEFRKSLQ